MKVLDVQMMRAVVKHALTTKRLTDIQGFIFRSEKDIYSPSPSENDIFSPLMTHRFLTPW
jgi:hypothetical protein